MLGPKITHPAALDVTSRCGGPAGLHKTGRAKPTEIAKSRARRIAAWLVDAILAALDEQTVVVPGTEAAILPRLADSLREVLPEVSRCSPCSARRGRSACQPREPLERGEHAVESSPPSRCRRGELIADPRRRAAAHCGSCSSSRPPDCSSARYP
jgi:hypothetical protein